MNTIKSVKFGEHKDNHNVGKQNICMCRSSCKVSAAYRRLQPKFRCIDKIPNVSFHENSSVGSLAVPRGEMEGQRGRYDVESRYSQVVYESAQNISAVTKVEYV